MHIPQIYTFFQELFPELEEQELPLDSLDHFGQFFDWMNLNSIYLQALDLTYYAEHGFEDNLVFDQYRLPYGTLNHNIQQKVDTILNGSHNIATPAQHDKIVKLIICNMFEFLSERNFDLLIIMINGQKYWLTFPMIDQEKREYLIHLFKTEFNTEMPIDILDPQEFAVGC